MKRLVWLALLVATPALAKPAKEPTKATAVAPPVASAPAAPKPPTEEERAEVFKDYTYESGTGQKARAADALVAIVDDPAKAVYHADAYAKLGDLLAGMDLPYAALCAYVRAYEAAGDADLDIVGPSVPKAIALAGRVGDTALLEAPFSKNLGLARTEDVRGLMAYLAAREAFRNDSLGLASSMLKVVKEGDPFNPEARMLEAVILNRQGRADDALKPLEKAQKAARDKGDRFQAMVTLNTARTFYGGGNFARAIQYYAAVPRASELWPEAQYERAWAHFRVEDLNGALSVLYSLHTPFFADWYLPEADLLRIYSMFLMCKFPEADKEIGAFRAYWAPIHADLKAWGGKSDRENFDLVRTYLDTGDTGPLPKMILRPWGDEERIVAAITAYESAEDEMKRMKGAAANPFTEKAKEWVQARMDELVKDEGSRIRERIAAQEEQVGQMLADTEIFGLDILRMKTQLFEQAANIGKMPTAERNVKREDRLRKGWREWPFEGEIWADELGYYRVTAEPECPASMRKESLD
ncbi:MAG: tetratricopeptide repeat protein [Myxococcota bacterium]